MKKRNERVYSRMNAFSKYAKGKCPVIAYLAPSPAIIECLIDNELAAGVGYYNGFEGKEVGVGWFMRKWDKELPRGPGGVRYLGYPDWEEVSPPGKPVPPGGPVEHICDLNEESTRLIKDNDLFFYSFLYYDPKEAAPTYRDMFGDRFIASLIMEADGSVVRHIRERHEKKPFADRDEVFKTAMDFIKKECANKWVYGLSGSGVFWYQGAQVSKQKRWDHEIANGNFQVQAAFLHGVSRQYGIPFITYVAPMGNSPEGLWSTKADPETPFGKVFNCTYFAGGKPDDLLEREWYFAWFHGSSAVILEASEFYLFKKGKKKGSFEPGCMAGAAKKLNRLTGEFDRGEPYRPGCILLDERGGWDMPSGPDGHNYNPPRFLDRKIWGIFDYQHQDIMIDNFFGAVYPGYESGGMWGHCRGDLVQTPYGESFDVLYSNASGKALGQYPAVFVVGNPKLTPGYRRRLENYVRAGGDLVLNISQVDYKWEKFLGVKFTPKYNRWYKGLGTLRASDWSEWLEPKLLWKEERYHYTRLDARGAKVLAVTEQGDPLVLCHKVGKGRVWLATAHYIQEISGVKRPNGLLEIGRFLIGRVLEPHQKIGVRGKDINWHVNETEKGLSVLLLNNGPETWTGWVTVPGICRAKVKEWYAEEAVHSHTAGAGLSIRLTIPGNDLRLLSIEHR